MRQKQTHRHRELACGCQSGVGKGCSGNLVLADANYIYRMDNNKVLLNSTGKYQYIKYPVINHNGKNIYNRMFIYV